MKKKILSIILAVTLIVTTITVAMVSVSANTDENGRYIPSTTDTRRYYFYMPKDWENNYTKDTIAGVYWWGGTDACKAIDDDIYPDSPAWPGHVAQYEGTYAEGSIYYIDCPTDVGRIVWNNYINGGTREKVDPYDENSEYTYQFSEDQYFASLQTCDICSEYYDPGESDLYPDGIDEEVGFNNMIFVCDVNKYSKNELNGKGLYGGEWYYYYGDGKYGVQPTIDEAYEANAVMDTAYQPPKIATEPDTKPEPDNYDKTINFDVISANWGSGVKAVYCHIYNYADNDGKRYADWMSKAEKCDYNPETGIATYYLSTGIDKGANGLETIDNTNKWVIMFSSNTGEETHTLLFNSDCFGDTIIADPNTKFEHKIDWGKRSIKISYLKNTNLTTPKCITSTAKVQGETLAYGDTNESLLGEYLATYAIYDTKVNKDIVSSLADELGINASDAFIFAEEMIDMDNVNYPTYRQKKEAIKAVKAVLDAIEEDVNSRIIGDIDGDGKITIDDATDIQKYVAEIYDFTYTQKKCADVNKDGKVGVDDVTLIQKYLAGMAKLE